MAGSSLTQWMATVFARSEQGRPQPDEYFTPRLVSADRQLQALATRLGGAYRRGALEWSSWTSSTSGGTSSDPIEALWGRGSRVEKRLHGLEIEVTVGVQALNTGESGDGAVARWLVLAPGVTVAAGPRSKPLVFHRFDANWSADEELATGADRLRRLFGRGAVPPRGPGIDASIHHERPRPRDRKGLEDQLCPIPRLRHRPPPAARPRSSAALRPRQLRGRRPVRAGRTSPRARARPRDRLVPRFH